MITNGSHFTRDFHFEQLAPIYAVAAQEIEDYIRSVSYTHLDVYKRQAGNRTYRIHDPLERRIQSAANLF